MSDRDWTDDRDIKADMQVTEEMRIEWAEWLEGRPPIVRAVAERLPPWLAYRLTTTGQVCRVLAISEDGTVRIYAEHPALGPITGTGVFGIDPDTLVPWNPQN